MLIRSGDSSLFPQFNGMLTNYAVQTGYVP